MMTALRRMELRISNGKSNSNIDRGLASWRIRYDKIHVKYGSEDREGGKRKEAETSKKKAE